MVAALPWVCVAGNQYSRYEGTATSTHVVETDRPLFAEDVETLRTNPEALLSDAEVAQ